MSIDFALSPPSIKHLPEQFNNQEMFNSWWKWRLFYQYMGGSSIPPQQNIPAETYRSRQERFRLWREIAMKADKQAKYV